MLACCLNFMLRVRHHDNHYRVHKLIRERLIEKRDELNSANKFGARKFLAEIIHNILIC